MSKPKLKGILSGFHKTLTQLDVLIKANANTMITNDGKINAMEKQNSALLSENDQAANIASNIKNLLGKAA